ncbi:carboxypeptidase-like regulatory domain-containing protein [Pedobacter agri]|uniref:carboxypeptidase-like regulatory domain-containing protein n=1 Tax=Pedobacter agri TaxID=454586 RepID=UPI00292DCB19|nr:carboxypeptidase-like regulatory domain-containing protein [Pedobacter agri]
MATSFKISVNNPCGEKWLNMQPDEVGRFCNSCQKSVTDFTQFSDQDLKDWFAKNHGSTCGRFDQNQLHKLFVNESKFSIKRFKSNLIGASLFAFLSFPKVSKATLTRPEVFQTDSFFNRPNDTFNSSILSDSLKIIKGKVSDKENQSPIPGAVVKVNNGLITVSTDEKGMFEIRLPEDYRNDDCTLAVSWIGYKTLNSMIYLKDKKQLNLELCESAVVLGGAETIYVRNPSIWDRLRKLFGKKN